MANIGEPIRIIEVEPVTLPVLVEEPASQPNRVPVESPAATPEEEPVVVHEPV